MRPIEELKMDARRVALEAAKLNGWKPGGDEYQAEYNKVLDAMIMAEIVKR